MYKRGADGVAKKGRTEGKNLGNDGPKVGVERGGKKSAGLTSEKMKAVGRGLAKVANQGG